MTGLVQCGNHDHPDGPWHPAMPNPPTWAKAETVAFRNRKERWGCGCPAAHVLECPLHGPVYNDDGSPYCPECDHAPTDARWYVHNLLAHPLLVLWPKVGAWLHDRTADPGDVEFVYVKVMT